jgi:hypothetical protein
MDFISNAIRMNNCIINITKIKIFHYAQAKLAYIAPIKGIIYHFNT